VGHIDAAHCCEEWQYADGDEGQPGVHAEQVDECSYEHGQGAEHRRQCLGEEGDDLAHVALQSVDDVAGVHGLAPLPQLLQQAGHQLLLHAVLSAHAQYVAYPDA
jgi:hypothetical protein